jgi:Uma2 family endonuclease
MSALQKPHRVTFDEYVAFEETSEARHELINGVVFAMSGSPDTHNLICTNLVLLIAGPLKGRCQTFQGMMKLRVAHQSDSDGYYPDIMVACQPNDRERLFRSEPTLLIEVLSPSTERVDRGEKLLNYLNIPSLQTYVIISQAVPQVEVISREEAWKPQYLFLRDTLVLTRLGLNIPVTSIYDTISF